MKIQRKIKRQIKRTLAAVVVAGLTAFNTTPVFALPTGGNVIQGTININDLTNILVNGNGVINWNSFSISNGETVNFHFTDAYGVLNRVTGAQMSELAGTLSSSGANGSVFLVNPNGVTIANGATINANNLVVSTLNISDENFMQMVVNLRDEDGAIAKFSKGDRDIAAGIAINGGSFGSESLTLIGGTVTVAPGVTISGGEEIAMIAANEVHAQLEQANNDEMFRLYNTPKVIAQTANTITITDADLSADSTIDLIGGQINVSNSSLDSYDIELKAWTKLETPNDDTTVSTATPDNTLTITDSVVSVDGELMGFGGKIAVTNSQFNLNGVDTYYTNASSLQLLAANKVTVNDYETDQYRLSLTATKDNSIDVNGLTVTTALNEGDLWLLGGAVTLNNAQFSGNEIFIGAGGKLGIENTTNSSGEYVGEYYFTNQLTSTAGNVVTIDSVSNITAHGESAIYGNAINNAGTITSHAHYGLALSAYDSMQFNNQTGWGTVKFSANNVITNSGTITADQANYNALWDPTNNVLRLMAGTIENTGSLSADAHAGGVATLVFAAGSSSGIVLDNTIMVTERELDLDNADYKIVMNENWVVDSIEQIGGGSGIVPVDPTVEGILDDPTTSLAEKQEQLLIVVQTINNLPAAEQSTAIAGAISAINENTNVAPVEKQALATAVVTNYTGSAAVKQEADNQIVAAQHSVSVSDQLPTVPVLANPDVDTNNVTIEK